MTSRAHEPSHNMQVWLAPGSGLADDFFDVIKSVSANPEFVMVAVFAVFAIVHSGLAAVRPQGTAWPCAAAVMPPDALAFLSRVPLCTAQRFVAGLPLGLH